MATGWVADYTSEISVASLKAAGIVGVCRYVSRSSWKVLSKGEYDRLRAGGLIVVPNFEDEANGWLGGGSAGTADGVFTGQQVSALGFPKGTVVPNSADFNMSLSEWNSSCKAYAINFAKALEGFGYLAGVYGPWDVLQWCSGLGTYHMFWQSESTSFSNYRNANQWPGTDLWQKLPARTVGGTQVDYNQICQPNWWGVTDMELTDTLKVSTGETKQVKDIYNDTWMSVFKGQGPFAGQVLTLLNTIAQKVDVDPAELVKIQDAAKAGATQALAMQTQAIIDGVKAALPQGQILTVDDVEQALKNVLPTVHLST